MGTRKTRQRKIDWVITRIKVAQTQKIALDEKKLLGEFALENGTQERTGKDILESLEHAGKIVRTAGFVMTSEQYEYEKAGLETAERENKSETSSQNTSAPEDTDVGRER